MSENSTTSTTTESMSSFLPIHVWNKVLPLAYTIAAFYAIQPVYLRCVLLNSSVVIRGVGFGLFCGTFAYLAISLRHALGEYYSFNVNLLWWLYALLFVKYVHATLAPQQLITSVGLYNNDCSSSDDDNNKKKKNDDNWQKKHTNKTLSWTRLCIFCYCPPTPVFANLSNNAASTAVNGAAANTTTNNGSSNGHTTNGSTAVKPKKEQEPRRSVLFYAIRGLIQLVIMSQLSQAVLTFELYNRLPYRIQTWLGFYMICLSQGGLADLFLSAPTRALLGPFVGLVEPSDAPCLSIHPRTFWHRWSKAVGFHFRQCLYEPVGGYQHQYIATTVIFGLNTVLHIFFWGPISTPETRLAWNYIYVLFVAPALALVLDHFVWKPFCRRGSALYQVANWITLQVLASWLMPYFLDAQGMPTNLRDLALVQTGQL